MVASDQDEENALLRLARTLRAQAEQTNLTEYADLMLKTAAILETEWRSKRMPPSPVEEMVSGP